MAELLLEIGVEEIPARMVDGAREELKKKIEAMLAAERLAGSETKLEAFSTPRRLAVIANGIATSQPDVEEQLTGPSLKVAYKDGSPTPAAEAFAKKAGVEVSQLGKTTNAKGEYLSAVVHKKGRAAAEVLAEELPKVIASIYWAKNMYWRGKTSERFVRPVRWLVALLDGKVVPFEFGGVRSFDFTRGHRVMGEEKITVTSGSDYKEKLEKNGVIVDQNEREQRIRKALDAAARTIPGARWRADDALKAIVVNLTENPSAIIGSFEREFLSLPQEVLITVMRDHQKYFALDDADGKLAPHFLAVLNTNGDPDGLIRHGNERVLRARFNDARFFWQTDQKIPLKDRVEMLKSVTFQKDLGHYHEKSSRVATLATLLAADLAETGTKIDRNAVHEAAWLAKTDLTSELVKEFTELQGVVGGLYARAQGASQKVADAIYDHYKPNSMEGDAPRSLEAAVLAVADKADTIAGMFALGLQPTGSKDPFALRRQANGIVRTLAELKLNLDVLELMDSALAGYKGSEAAKKFKTAEFKPGVAAFFRERIEFYLREKGFAYDEVNSVLAAGTSNIPDVTARAAAVAEVRKSADFEPISVAFKRIKNILRQAEAKEKWPKSFDQAGLKEPQELALAEQVTRSAKQVAKLKDAKDYSGALAEVAKLRPLLDDFFEKVMVMAEDAKLRANRLALLDVMLREFSTIADFSEISTEKK